MGFLTNTRKMCSFFHVSTQICLNARPISKNKSFFSKAKTFKITALSVIVCLKLSQKETDTIRKL